MKDLARSRVAIVICVVAWCAMSACADRGGRFDRATLALVGLDVVDVVSGAVASDQTVVIEDDRIAAIGRIAPDELPNAIRIVEFDRAWAIPGMIELAYVPRSDDRASVERSLSRLLASGVTSARPTRPSRALTALVDAASDRAPGRPPLPRLFPPSASASPSPEGATSPGPERDVDPVVAFFAKLAARRASGATALEALREVTDVAGGELDGLDVGRLEVGYLADVSVLASNPLETTEALRSPVGVVVRGRFRPARAFAPTGPSRSTGPNDRRP